MRYVIISDLGGLLWWIFIKFCKTKLEDEQAQNRWSRNIFFILTIVITATFVVIRFY